MSFASRTLKTSETMKGFHGAGTQWDPIPPEQEGWPLEQSSSSTSSKCSHGSNSANITVWLRVTGHPFLDIAVEVEEM